MSRSVDGKRVLVTQCDDFMGPACVEIFRREGASVMADSTDLRSSDVCRNLIDKGGRYRRPHRQPCRAQPLRKETVTEVEDADWQEVFDLLVHPLHWLVRAALPKMIERRRGKIVVFGSATPLRPDGTFVCLQRCPRRADFLCKVGRRGGRPAQCTDQPDCPELG